MRLLDYRRAVWVQVSTVDTFSQAHIGQQHVIDHLQNIHRNALAVLQGSFDTGNILCTSCIVVIRLSAA